MTAVATANNPDRWHDLDAVRALALMLGVVLHGVMSFMAPRVWIVADPLNSPGASIVFYVIHMFRLTTFFVLAGFFARLLLQKRTVAGFIGNRLKRVGAPLLMFWPISIVAIVAIMIIANMPPPDAPRIAPPPPPTPSVDTFPLTHLWFLYVLLLLYAGTVAIKLLTDILHIGRPLGRVLDAVVGALIKYDLIAVGLALPAATAFYLSPAWKMWFGVETPDTGLIPNGLAVAAFTTAFTFGWWLHRRSDLIAHLASRCWLYAVAAAAGTIWCLMTAGPTPVLTPTTGHDHPLYCLVYPLTAWSWAFALIGGAHLILHRENPAIRFVADASYWVYIIHLPLVLLFQYLVKGQDWPVAAKIAAVLFGTLAVALLSYRLFVRYSFIGTILNGRRHHPSLAAKAEAKLREAAT